MPAGVDRLKLGSEDLLIEGGEIEFAKKSTWLL